MNNGIGPQLSSTFREIVQSEPREASAVDVLERQLAELERLEPDPVARRNALASMLLDAVIELVANGRETSSTDLIENIGTGLLAGVRHRARGKRRRFGFTRLLHLWIAS